MSKRNELKIKIFADGAKVAAMKQTYKEGLVRGFTTNPTLMRKAGVENYAVFAREVLSVIKDLPISFEVFSDDFDGMEREARAISNWGSNVNVKIPITNTKGEFCGPLIQKLSNDGIALNITACLTLEQVKAVSKIILPQTKTIISVFAGRIADTGCDPAPIMKAAAKILERNSNAELLWASSREVLNIFQAIECGCHIITVTNDILKKIPLLGKELNELSLDTVKMFYSDARAAGYQI